MIFISTTRAWQRATLISAAVAMISACGGESEGGNGGLLNTNPNPTPTPVVSNPPNPVPPGPPQPSPEPNPTPNPGPSPTPAPVQGAPTITQADTGSGNLSLAWTDVGAMEYRVLYWQGNDDPYEQRVSGTQTDTGALVPGRYTVLVEAYDALGSSLFSTPRDVEIR